MNDGLSFLHCSRCAKILPLAEGAYQEGLPPHYTQSYHVNKVKPPTPLYTVVPRQQVLIVGIFRVAILDLRLVFRFSTELVIMWMPNVLEGFYP